MLADEGFGEWGFAALVEADGRRILFDTGANEDTVLRNLSELGIDLKDVEIVVLSHNHADHTTGLLTLRRKLMAASPTAVSKVYAGHGLFWPRLSGSAEVDERMMRIRKEYEATGAMVVDVAAPVEIVPGVWLTGPVPRIHPERNWGSLGRVRSDRGDVEDTVPEDMTLVVQTAQGLVTLFGCGHAGVINTLDHVRKTIDPSPIKAVIGGLHLFAADEKALAWTAGQLKRFQVKELIGAHCTGIESVYRLRVLTGLLARPAWWGPWDDCIPREGDRGGAHREMITQRFWIRFRRVDNPQITQITQIHKITRSQNPRDHMITRSQNHRSRH